MKTKNHMEEVAKILGVELYEEFKIENENQEYLYGFTENGLLVKIEEYWVPSCKLNDLLVGRCKVIKLPWSPKVGKVYYKPSAKFDYTIFGFWANNSLDFAFKEAGMVFKTKDECDAALPALRKKYLGVE